MTIKISEVLPVIVFEDSFVGPATAITSHIPAVFPVNFVYTYAASQGYSAILLANQLAIDGSGATSAAFAAKRVNSAGAWLLGTAGGYTVTFTVKMPATITTSTIGSIKLYDQVADIELELNVRGFFGNVLIVYTTPLDTDPDDAFSVPGGVFLPNQSYTVKLVVSTTPNWRLYVDDTVIGAGVQNLLTDYSFLRISQQGDLVYENIEITV